MDQFKKYINNVKLTKESKVAFELDVLHNNLLIGTVLLLFSFAFQMFNTIRLAVFETETIGQFPNNHYLLMYVSLAVVSLVYLIIIFFLKKDIQKYHMVLKMMLFFFVLFIALWGTYITLLDLSSSDNVIVYIIMIIAIAITVFEKPWVTTCILVCNHAIFCLFFSAYQKAETNNTGNLINTTAVVMLALIIVYYRYYTSVVGFKNNQYITKQNKRIRARNEELKKLAITDSLSGLYNRRLLDQALSERMEQCLADQQMLSVIMFDIDNFKNINDHLGHQIGDQCIEQVACVIRECTEDLPAMSFRYGGEEFTVFIYQMEANQVVKTIEEIRKRVHYLELNELGQKRQDRVTICAGICSGIPTPGISFRQYINIADEALRKAKRDGKDRVISAAIKPELKKIV